MLMSADFHEIEAEIRYLTTEEGGRRTPVCSDYRGQFFYDGEDYDGSQYFPDLPDGVMLELGTPVRALIRFRQEMWEDVHSKRIAVGMPFQIREGNRTVGHGVVTKVCLN
jgi:translation elongation factor EF-Tu-like GTPase